MASCGKSIRLLSSRRYLSHFLPRRHLNAPIISLRTYPRISFGSLTSLSQKAFVIGFAVGMSIYQYRKTSVSAQSEFVEDAQYEFEFSMMELQWRVAAFIENEQFEELVEFLYSALKEVEESNTVCNKDYDERIDFLETKLCGILCKMNRAADAVQIVGKYTESQLIDNKSLLRVAYVFHSAQQFERAIRLYELAEDNMEQQLKDRIRKDHLPMVQQEIVFTVQMHLAQCHTGLGDIEKAKSIYMDLPITDILKYGADKSIAQFYDRFGSKEEAVGFREFVQLHLDNSSTESSMPY